MRRWARRLVALTVAALSGGCGDHAAEPPREVVVFTALDRVYSEPILRRFEERTGIRVLAKYDVEAAKTTGLVNQIIARAAHPECDVFWNNEMLQTAHLARLGRLQPYDSPFAARFDARFRDPAARWTGFAARARVIIYNTDLVDPADVPRSLAAFTDPRWRGRAAIAMPFFGTTFTHLGMLREQWGDERLAEWLVALRANDVAVAPGNGPVRDLVASGERWFGLTDTDDAQGAIADGKPVVAIIPDPDDGVALIPNTVGLITGCPNPVEGRALIDFLLSEAVETALAETRGAQIPLGADLRDMPSPWAAIHEFPALPLGVSQDHPDGRDTLVALLREVGFDR